MKEVLLLIQSMTFSEGKNESKEKAKVLTLYRKKTNK